MFKCRCCLVPTTPPVAHGKMRSEGQAPFSNAFSGVASTSAAWAPKCVYAGFQTSACYLLTKPSLMPCDRSISRHSGKQGLGHRKKKKRLVVKKAT